MRGKLGGGRHHLEGYVSIHIRLSEQTRQFEGIADRQADLLRLSYLESSVDEIHLHHVFEHFPDRQPALSSHRGNRG